MKKLYRSLLVGGLALVTALSASAATTTGNSCVTASLREVLAPKGVGSLSPTLNHLEKTLEKLTPDGAQSDGKGVKVVMAAIELGQVQGLKTADGKPVNVAAGGVSAVLNDISKYYPKLLSQQKNGELTIVGLLMDGMSKDGMSKVKDIQVPVDGKMWNVGVYEYKSPSGTKYVFLDNPSFQRFTVTPDPKVQGQSIYTMRGLEAGRPEDRLEEQRIWSAFNQSVARVFSDEQAQIYVPHDSHVSPASFYIHKRMGDEPIASKPLVHNEGYLGSYSAGEQNWDPVRRIWSLEGDEMNQYFMQGDQLVMMAPAVRVAEQKEVFSALSVSDGTADMINGTGAGAKARTQIDFFDRVGALTNGLGEENRPNLSALLKPGPEAEVKADGIVHPEVIDRFKGKGYQFGFPGQSGANILKAKADAKRALQLNFGMTVDPNKPMFVSFARMVHQKGLEFVARNIEHILAKGGQVIVGGPVGDAIGAAERQMFLSIKERLIKSGNPNAANFVFIDGPVKGRLKGLTLAGGDFFPIPSRYEPCGLTDCEALYNGTIPIAHNVGGLNKGKATILYGPTNPDDQGWKLGEAINQAFAKYQDRAKFAQSQVDAMKEDFSIEKNFSRFLEVNRIETFGKMFREIDQLVRTGAVTEEQARKALRQTLHTEHAKDVPELVNALKAIHPSRRTPLMDWVISN